MKLARTAALALAVAAAPLAFAGEDERAAAEHAAAVAEHLATVEHTAALLDDDLAERRARIADRLRAYYKLSRAAAPRLWLDRRARAQVLRVRGATRRILRRELGELAQVEAERAAIAAARARLRAEPLSLDLPAPRSLFRPVVGAAVAAPFGRYRDRRTGTHLVRQGVELAARRGRDVRAAAAGQVVHAGPLRGLGRAVVIDHGDFATVLAGLDALRCAVGDAVERGEVVAAAAGKRVHFEVRTSVRAIDPAPLLAP